VVNTAAMIQYTTTKEKVFSVGSAPGIYNEDLRQLELKLRDSTNLTFGRIIKKKWQQRS
jgi:hypothetical protein